MDTRPHPPEEAWEVQLREHHHELQGGVYKGVWSNGCGLHFMSLSSRNILERSHEVERPWPLSEPVVLVSSTVGGKGLMYVVN